ncbi:MAG: aminotransferase class I/II-fold pyridoxal phosphate-dependent enzyme [Flavobacteriales bacterium AspAUS03]
MHGTRYVILESLYSMDGDIATLSDLVALCQKHSVYLIINEMHSTGI